jgi:tetratricopeptide (TPR) repeat protein
MTPGPRGKLLAAAAAQFFCAAWLCFPVVAGEPGTAGASFLKITPSPRATAMGEAYTSLSEDAYAAYWNPAGLAGVERPEAAATYNASFEDVAHQYVAVAYPLRYGSALGFSVTRMTVAPFQGYDATGLKTRDVQSSDMAIGASYGRTLLKDEIGRPVLNVGAGLKRVSETLDNASAATLALDLGAAYSFRPANYWMSKLPAQEMRLAFTVRNLGPGLKFDKVSAPLPLAATLGASWLSHPRGDSSLILSVDNTVSRDEKYTVNLGAEYEAFQLLAFRAGFKTGQAEGSGVRFGFGFKFSLVDLDYSMSPFGDLGSMHKFGLTMKFGAAAAGSPLAGRSLRVENARLITTKDKIEKLRVFSNEYIELANADLAKRRYVSAEGNFNKAFNLEPALKDGEWGGKAERLAALVKALRLKDAPGLEEVFSRKGEQAAAGHEAILAYFNGNELKAFLLAHAAWGADRRGDAVYEELLNVLSRATGNNIRRDEILPRTALVKEKLRKAAAAFYIRQFTTAVRECEEAVLLDEGSAIAWTRLGSAYFMMGDKEKSRNAYQKALKLNPGDDVTRQFMEAQGWK